MLFPNNKLKFSIEVCQKSRSIPTVSCDGREGVQLEKGQILEIGSSEFPLKCVRTSHGHWYRGINEKLNWNKPLPKI